MGQKNISCANRTLLVLVSGLLPVLLVDPLKQSIQKKAQVTLPLPERRKLESRHRQAVEQILPESSGDDLVDKDPIGGRDNSHVDAARRR